VIVVLSQSSIPVGDEKTRDISRGALIVFPPWEKSDDSWCSIL